MKRKRFTEEPIIGVLKQAEAGAKTADPCRQVGITQQMFYRWKAKYEVRRFPTPNDYKSWKQRIASSSSSCGLLPGTWTT